MADLLLVSGAILMWKESRESEEAKPKDRNDKTASYETYEHVIDVCEAEPDEKLKSKLLLRWVSRQLRRLPGEKIGNPVCDDLLKKLERGLITAEIFTRTAVQMPASVR